MQKNKYFSFKTKSALSTPVHPKDIDFEWKQSISQIKLYTVTNVSLKPFPTMQFLEQGNSDPNGTSLPTLLDTNCFIYL